MTYILDTQAWLWSVLDHPRLSRRARAALARVSPDERVGLAAISLKEAAWHLARGRIAIDPAFGEWPLWLRTAAGSPLIDVLPLTVDIAIESEALGDRVPLRRSWVLLDGVVAPRSAGFEGFAGLEDSPDS